MLGGKGGQGGKVGEKSGTPTDLIGGKAEKSGTPTDLIFRRPCGISTNSRVPSPTGL
jgi:hypothetical protein